MGYMINPKLPVHLGFILDGNRRWAKSQRLPTLEGHKQGYDNLREITKAAVNAGVQYISAFVFSTENWNRTPKEVKYLMDLALIVLTRDVAELNEEDIKVVWLGSREKVSDKLLKAIADAEALTQNNTRGTLAICFNYGGQQEIADMARSLVSSGLPAAEITPAVVAQHLYHPEVPPIDLLVRTSGEQRISGFMLYRVAYAEFMFVNKHWPDFNKADLEAVLLEYNQRQRRFGQ
jgi:undecaprenyl diphosphate synthase